MTNRGRRERARGKDWLSLCHDKSVSLGYELARTEYTIMAGPGRWSSVPPVTCKLSQMVSVLSFFPCDYFCLQSGTLDSDCFTRVPAPWLEKETKKKKYKKKDEVFQTMFIATDQLSSWIPLSQGTTSPILQKLEFEFELEFGVNPRDSKL